MIKYERCLRKMTSRVLSVLLVLAMLLLFSGSPVNAAQQGDVTGTFGINAPPTVDAVDIAPVSLTPHTQYTVSVTVSDPDTINDLSTVVLKLWYDSDGGTPTELEFDAQSANAQNTAVITWTADAPGGTTYTGSAVLEPAGTTWSLGACTLPIKGAGPNPGDFGLATFTFQFVFTVGKVATETIGAAKWQIAVKATDTQSQSSFNYDAEGAAMNFYGEIIVPATTVSFGDLGPGSDFADNNQPIGVTITYITNGAYDKKILTSATWTGATFTATLDATEVTVNAQEFSLKADETANLATAVLVDTVGVIIDDTGTQTTEVGEASTTNNLWIRLASTFNKDVYSGTITYIIANRL